MRSVLGSAPIEVRIRSSDRSVSWVGSTALCVFCGRPWEPGRVSHSREHIWPQWIRKHAGDIPAEKLKASTGLMMDPLGQSFREVPLVVSRSKSSILNTVTREVCDELERARAATNRFRTSWVDTSPLSIWEIRAMETPIQIATCSWVIPRRLRRSASREPRPASRSRRIERFLAAGGFHGLLQETGITPA